MLKKIIIRTENEDFVTAGLKKPVTGNAILSLQRKLENKIQNLQLDNSELEVQLDIAMEHIDMLWDHINHLKERLDQHIQERV